MEFDDVPAAHPEFLHAAVPGHVPEDAGGLRVRPVQRIGDGCLAHPPAAVGQQRLDALGVGPDGEKDDEDGDGSYRRRP